jgi:DNA repair protein RAD16
LRSPIISDDSGDEDFEDGSDLMSEVVVKYPPTPRLSMDFEDDDDIYGEQLAAVSSSRTHPSKKRKVTKSFATPVSTNSKSSSSSVFSPADSLDTPSTSICNSIRKVSSALYTAKRKLEAISVADSDESEFQLEEEEEEDTLSIAPTISSEESAAPQNVAARRRRTVQVPRNRRKWNVPRLSQWERTNLALCEYHPELACIWDELETAPLITPVKVPQPEGLSLQLLPFQLEGLDWLLKQEKQLRFGGGILADEMGMGKTIQTIALLLAEPRGKPNLVVAPTVALMQWKSEIETHTNNGLSVCLFYGTNRSFTAKQLKEYDVVLTTCMRRHFPADNRRGTGKCLS